MEHAMVVVSPLRRSVCTKLQMILCSSAVKLCDVTNDVTV